VLYNERIEKLKKDYHELCLKNLKAEKQGVALLAEHNAYKKSLEQIKFYDRKIVLCDTYFLLTEYAEPIAYNLPKKTYKQVVRPPSERSEADYVECKQRALRRAKATIKGVVASNNEIWKTFWTLTYAENQGSVSDGWRDFRVFMRRLKRKFPALKYLVVVEFQKRGAVHFHLITNIEYISNKALAQKWGFGFVKIQALDKIENVSAYISKYITKDNVDSRFDSEKMWSRSRGLKNPVEYTDNTIIDDILSYAEVKRCYTWNAVTTLGIEKQCTLAVLDRPLLEVFYDSDFIRKLSEYNHAQGTKIELLPTDETSPWD